MLVVVSTHSYRYSSKTLTGYLAGELVLHPSIHLQNSTRLQILRVGSTLSPCILAIILLQRSTTSQLKELVIDLGEALQPRYDWRALDQTLARDQFSRLKSVTILVQADPESLADETIRAGLPMLQRQTRLAVVFYPGPAD